MKKILSALFFGLLSFDASAQMHTDNNGLKTTTTNNIAAQSSQAIRFEVMTIGYNSYHWQGGGVVILELFSTSYATGYEKYIVEVGYFQGANSGSPRVRLVNSYGATHNARIVLGTPSDISTSIGGKMNRILPVYMDVRDYSTYKVKFTYLQNRVNEITDFNQVRIQENPPAANLVDFAPNRMVDDDFVSSGLLKVSGNGNHYFQNGNVGIGTTQPDAKLSVKGKIHAEEIKVDLNIPGPDYVFNDDYKLLPLVETDAYIKAHHHLPDIPSALEMKNNGINVSEMQMKLLQKIEELTLHTIQQDQKINRLIEIIERNHLK